MISHQHKCIFIHIPKNAGQSIEHVFLKLLDLEWETRAPLLLRPNDKPELGPPRLAHLKACEYVGYKYLSQELFDEYFKFTFVRNPWDRLVSIYKHLGFDRQYEFNAFLMKAFDKKVWRNKYWFAGPQSDFIVDEYGKIQVDFIGRFENLQNDFYKVCQAIGLPPIELPHVNKSTGTSQKLSSHPKQIKDTVSQIRRRRVPTFKKYQDYYNNESRELVASLYKKDIDLFRYKFDDDLPS